MVEKQIINKVQDKTQIYQAVVVQPEDGDFLRQVLTILFRQKFYIIGFFLITFVSMTVFALLSPQVFQSDARLFIQLGRESMSVDPSVVGPTTYVSSSRENELNSEVAVLTSRVLAEEVVDEIGAEIILKPIDGSKSEVNGTDQAGSEAGFLVWLGLKEPLPPSEIAVAEVMENLSVGLEEKSHIINLGLQAESPHLAKNLLTVLVDKYLDRHIEMHQAQAPLAFFKERAEELRIILEQKEEAFRIFQEQNSMRAMEGQKAKVLDQVSLLQTEMDQVVGLIGASDSKIESIKQSLVGRSPHREINRVTGRPSRTVEAIKDRLFDLRAQEADLAARYLDTDRALIDLREKIKLAEAQLSQESVTHTEITRGIDTNYQALRLNLANERAQLEALRARQEILEGQLEKRQADLLELSDKEIILKRIQREIGIANSEYQQYRDNLQRAKISADLDSGRISNVNIVQPPTLSIVPIKSRKKLMVFLGFFLGVFGGVGLAFFREYLDSTMKAPEDVEEMLGLPVLASISRKEFEACI